MAQPIIRGIQAVGAVDIKYRYNGSEGKLTLPKSVMALGGSAGGTIDTGSGVDVSGFRLDSEFLRAVQQIASSVQIPILGGGAVALTNNNRSGQLSIRSTKVSTPKAGSETDKDNIGSMLSGNGVGPVAGATAYDIVFLAQAQQAQDGGDSVGATLYVSFSFCGLYTTIIFEGCTVVSVDPLALAGNDAPDYNVVFNYLNWNIDASAKTATSKLDPWAPPTA